MKMLITAILSAVCILFPVYGTELVLKDGTVCRGFIISENSEFFMFQVGSSKLKINKLLIIEKDGVRYAGARVAPQPSVKPLAPAIEDQSTGSVKTKQPAVPSQDWVVTLKNGSLVRGKCISENARILVLDVQGSSQSVFKNTIAAIDSSGSASFQLLAAAGAGIPQPRNRSAPEPIKTKVPPSVPPDNRPVSRSGTTWQVQTATEGKKAVVPVKPRSQENLTTSTSTGSIVAANQVIPSPAPIPPQVSMAAPPPVIPKKIKAEMISFENKTPPPVEPLPVASRAVPMRENRQQGIPGAQEGALPRPKPRVNVISFAGDAPSSPVQPLPGNQDSPLPAEQPPSEKGNNRPDQSSILPAGASSGTSGGLTVVPAPRFNFAADRSKQAEKKPPVSSIDRTTGVPTTITPPSVNEPPDGSDEMKAIPTPHATGTSREPEQDEIQTAATTVPSPVVEHIPPLALKTPAPLPGALLPGASLQKKDELTLPHRHQPPAAGTSAGIGQRQAAPPPPTTMAMAPAQEPRKRRTDGKKELILMDGTVFIGKISSQTEHVIFFSSEGASISILKRLIRTIDGEPYLYVKSSGADSLPPQSNLTSTAPPGPQVKKLPVTHALFRMLPRSETSQGMTASMLADSMQNATDWKSRSRAARNLGAMGPWGVSAIPSTVKLLSDTAQSAGIVPVWIDSLTVDILLAPGLEAARALSQLGAQGEAGLLQALKSDNPLLRRHAVFGLGNCFLESAEKAVKGALKDTDASIRRTALGSLRVSSSLPQLLSALKDSDAGVRSAAADLCGKLGDRSALEQVAKLSNDYNRQVRRAVAEALGTIGAAETVPALVDLCRDGDNFVRAEAVRSLGKIRDGSTVTTLIDMLKDQTADVRAAAVEALGMLRDSRSIPSLYAAMKDKNESVREKAQAAIRQLTELPLLIAALNDESTAVRANTAYVLWLLTGQDYGSDKTKWEAWAAQKAPKGTGGGNK